MGLQKPTFRDDDRSLDNRLQDRFDAAAARKLGGFWEVGRIAHELCASVPVKDCPSTESPGNQVAQVQQEYCTRDSGDDAHTLIRHRRCGDDDVSIVLIFQTLPEDVHVKGPQEPKPAPLP